MWKDLGSQKAGYQQAMNRPIAAAPLPAGYISLRFRRRHDNQSGSDPVADVLFAAADSLTGSNLPQAAALS